MTYMEYLREDVFPDEDDVPFLISMFSSIVTFMVGLSGAVSLLSGDAEAILGILVFLALMAGICIPTFFVGTFVYWLFVRNEDR